jgi:hypothetical protein
MRKLDRMKNKIIKDINNVTVETGDLILRPALSSFYRHYVLGYSSSGSLIVSCARTNSKWTYKGDPNAKNWWRRKIKDKELKGEGIGSINYVGYSNVTIHNGKQYLQYTPELLVIEKNCKIPEKLQKFIKR